MFNTLNRQAREERKEILLKTFAPFAVLAVKAFMALESNNA
jgi:hypothetical protein